MIEGKSAAGERLASLGLIISSASPSLAFLASVAPLNLYRPSLHLTYSKRATYLNDVEPDCLAMNSSAPTSPSTSPRRKRTAKSLAVSSDDEAVDSEGLKRVSMACVTCRRRFVNHCSLSCRALKLTPRRTLPVGSSRRKIRVRRVPHQDSMRASAC